MFSCEFYEILSNTDFEEHLRIAASVVTYTTTEKEKKKTPKKVWRVHCYAHKTRHTISECIICLKAFGSLLQFKVM